MSLPTKIPDLRHLVTLATIGRLGSFSAAAVELGYTQSAVSQQMSRLEKLVGHTLIDRPGGSRQVSLTQAGVVLLSHSEAITAQLESAFADLDAVARGAVGVLRVGCYQSVGVRILPRIVAAFRQKWPQVSLELFETDDDTALFEAVERGELDLTFVVYPMVAGPFTSVELLTDPYVVVTKRGDPLSSDSSVSPSALVGRSLVTYARMRDAHAIENRLGLPELSSQVVMRSHDHGTILGLVEAGVGAAVISALSVPTSAVSDGLCVRPLAGVTPRVVGLAWHSARFRMAAHQGFVAISTREAEAEQASLNLGR